MIEKLAQCIKMLDYIGQHDITFHYHSDHNEVMPFPQELDRSNKHFTLARNGLLTYWGGAEYFIHPPDKGKPVSLANLTPTEKILDAAIKKLEPFCRARAKELVIERMIDHQFKYDGLDFLLQLKDNNECDPNLH